MGSNGRLISGLNKVQAPPLVVWVVLLSCIIPFLFWPPFFQYGGPQAITEATLSPGIVCFAIWLMFGIMAALITGALSVVDYYVKRVLATPIIGAVLFTVGLYELFYLIYEIGQPITEESAYFRWFLSRMLQVVLMAGGVGYFSFINPRKLRNTNKKNFKLLLLSAFCLVVLFSAVSLTFFYTRFPSVKQDSLITHPLELAVLLEYVALGIFLFPCFSKRYPSLFSRLLSISIIPAALAQIAMAVHKQPFDVYFNSAYYLRVVNYLIPLLGIGFNYWETIRREKKIIKQLHSQIRERIITQHALKKREVLLANAEKIAKMGSWDYALETGEMAWSDGMYDILGLDIHQSRPSKNEWRDLILEPQRREFEWVLSSAAKNKEPYLFEFQIKKSDGEIRWLLGQGYFSAADNKLINTLLDVTELKEAHYQLSQRELLSNEAEALSHNGSWEWRQDKNAFYWSDELYRIHGLAPASTEVNLRFYLTLIHPDDVQHFVTILADTPHNLAPFSIEYRIIRPNGDVRYLSLKGKFITDFYGNVNKVLGNTQDITDLKNTSLLLERSESIYQSISRNMPDSAVFLFDREHSLVFAGGPSLDAVEGHAQIKNAESFNFLVFGDNFHKPLLYINSALSGIESRLDYKIDKKSFKITFSPVYLPGGGIFGALVVMHDISDIKMAQQELELKVLELNRSNKDLEQFAYIASHDLQEPLRKIRAFGERLKDRCSDVLPAEGMDYVNRMGSASERMQLLIDDLLTFSRISRKADELKWLSLHYAITQALLDLEYAIDKKHANIDINLSQAIKVKAVPTQLNQLLQNLLSNSLKFAAEGRPLQIKITSETVSGISRTSLLDDKEYCKIEIADNGIGFDNQYASKIFILFNRLHSRNEYPGTGIGLAICKKIVENHNGIIEADGKENEGALFRIFLPLN